MTIQFIKDEEGKTSMSSFHTAMLSYAPGSLEYDDEDESDWEGLMNQISMMTSCRAKYAT